jgi:hypothetical protein
MMDQTITNDYLHVNIIKTFTLHMLHIHTYIYIYIYMQLYMYLCTSIDISMFYGTHVAVIQTRHVQRQSTV